MSDRLAALSLVAEVGTILQLVDRWPPAGALCETLLSAMHGDGGMSRREVDRLRRWSRRLRNLDADLVRFYSRHADHPAVGAALWAALEGYDRPTGRRAGDLRRLWRDDHGADPWIDICPRPPTPPGG